MTDGIRSVEKGDVDALKSVLDSSELFLSEMLDDMISDYFNNPASEHIWFTKVQNGIPVSIAYCAPEMMTEGTYNLYAIAVDKKEQGKGIGTEMMQYIENRLRKEGNRILIVETSGDSEYELTRKFYSTCNYVQEARIRSFYSETEDKVIFWKALKDRS